MEILENCREIIDKIDSEIIKLYEKRMDIVKEVIEFKIKNNIPVLDSSREEKMLIKNLEKIKNEDYKKYYNSVLKGFLKASKDMQNDILKNKN